MPQFTNFYENVQEARLRLLNTVVTYDGIPCYVHWISDDHEDGKFRIYVELIGGAARHGLVQDRRNDFPNRQNYSEPSYSSVLDQWILNNPDEFVVRKYMSSAKLNKYRPFPLGNVNYNGEVIYVERRPTRQTIQGIRADSLLCEKVSASPNVLPEGGLLSKMSRAYVEPYSLEFVDCVLGNYPDYKNCIDHLRSAECGNSGLAFNRDFSVLRGPVRTLFLCYKTEGVGIVTGPYGNFLTLSEEFEYLKEQIEELNVYDSILVD